MSGHGWAWLEAAAQLGPPLVQPQSCPAVSLRCRPTLDPVLELLQLLMPILQQARQLCVSSLPSLKGLPALERCLSSNVLLLSAAYKSPPSWAPLPAVDFASRPPSM